jgi:Zn-dependent protease
MTGSFRIGRLAGIEIDVHYTWLFALLLIAWSLAEGFFPASFPTFDAITDWVLGFVSALLLFASVLVHELSHSAVAMQRGLAVRGITLFIFGGISEIAGEPRAARDEFAISVVGPLTSFALAGCFWLLGQALGTAATPVLAVTHYLAFVNLLLGVFNLVPGFPLDGGRVLRSVVWGATHDFRQATKVATVVGQLFGFLLIGWGMIQLLSGDFLGGVWTAFLGWFLNSAAESTRQAELATPRPLTSVPAELTLSNALQALADQDIYEIWVTEDGQVVGLLKRAGNGRYSGHRAASSRA